MGGFSSREYLTFCSNGEKQCEKEPSLGLYPRVVGIPRITVLIRERNLLLFRHSLYNSALCGGFLCLSAPVSPLSRVIPWVHSSPCIPYDVGNSATYESMPDSETGITVLVQQCSLCLNSRSFSPLLNVVHIGEPSSQRCAQR